jgi:hypothetical protein
MDGWMDGCRDLEMERKMKSEGVGGGEGKWGQNGTGTHD